MAQPNARNDDEPGGGFVTCPLWILTHPDLTDCDLRVLLMLDQIGHREGEGEGHGNGIVHASSEEVGRRIGKSPSTVNASIRRLEKVNPPVLRREMSSSSTRAGIVLLYDRYGNARVNAPDRGFVTTGETFTKPAENLTGSPTTPTANVTIGQDITEPVRISAGAGPCQDFARLPLKREDLVVVVEGDTSEISAGEVTGGVSVEVAAMLPVGPRTLPELIAWLPGYIGPVDDGEEDEREARRKLIARLKRDLPLWLPPFLKRFPEHSVGTFCDWVTDALIQSTDAADPLKYSRRILREWSKAGGRPGIEIDVKAPEPEVIAPADLPPVHPMPPPRIARFPSKAERNTARYEARRASMARLYPKEASDGPR